jgi:hypothetical protein
MLAQPYPRYPNARIKQHRIKHTSPISPSPILLLLRASPRRRRSLHRTRSNIPRGRLRLLRLRLPGRGKIIPEILLLLRRAGGIRTKRVPEIFLLWHRRRTTTSSPRSPGRRLVLRVDEAVDLLVKAPRSLLQVCAKGGAELLCLRGEVGGLQV